ncbi:hypothetical protein CYY_000735 [Polysphondylium violaceum]|uniref:separase n=1 Tax=Polysphondylium violaceum TaxID=133409 RepID=A0A8J4Q4A1_9MYCE|nr:hypothetical protein CYY_000735 [Polysphondylium violaceum]
MVSLSVDVESTFKIFEDKNEFLSLLQSKSNIPDIELEWKDKFNNLSLELIKQNDSKTLLTISDRLAKVLTEYLGSKTLTYKDGVSVLVSSLLVVLINMAKYVNTQNSTTPHKKWLLVGGILIDNKLYSKAFEAMSMFIELLSALKSKHPNNIDYFEKTCIHAMFLKMQCFEDSNIFNNSETSERMLDEFIKNYNSWFSSRFELADKPNMYHEAFFIKFYNRCAFFLSKIGMNDSQWPYSIQFKDLLFYHYNFVTWNSLAKSDSPIKFFDRLLIFLLILQKKNYYNDKNCWKMLNDIVDMIKVQVIPQMLKSNPEDPLYILKVDTTFIDCLCTISTFAIDSNQYTIAKELIEIVNQYLKKKKESNETSNFYQCELVIGQLHCWIQQCYYLLHQLTNTIENNQSPDTTDLEKELYKYLLTTHQLTEKAFVNSQFTIDAQNSIESKFSSIKFIGHTLCLVDQFVQLYIKFTKNNGEEKKSLKLEICQQIETFNEYYTLIPSVVNLKWLKAFDTLNPTKKFYTNKHVQGSLEEFIKNYSLCIYSLFKRMNGKLTDSFKTKLVETNSVVCGVVLNYTQGIEEFASYLYNLGTYFLKLIKPPDYSLAKGYIESSIQIINRILTLRKPPTEQTLHHMEMLSNCYFYASYIRLKVQDKSLEGLKKAHSLAIESIKCYFKGKTNFNQVLYESISGGKSPDTRSGAAAKQQYQQQRPFQEILRNYSLTLLHLFNTNLAQIEDFNQQQLGSHLSPLDGIKLINDIITIGDESFTIEFKIQVYDMMLLNFSQFIGGGEKNAHQLLLLQIDRFLNDLPSATYPILHARYLMERGKILRFYNPNKENIENHFQDSVDMIKNNQLSLDQPFHSAIYNELAKLHFWKAITHLELYQNQCKDILSSIRQNEKNSSLDYFDSSESELFKYSSKANSSLSISHFLRSSDSNRFRSPVGSSSSPITKELGLSISLWCKLLDSLEKPVLSAGKGTSGTTANYSVLQNNLKYFISPHTTLSILYNIADIYSFEGDYNNSIFVLKLVIALIKCLFSPHSMTFLSETFKCFNQISSSYLELNNTTQCLYYLQLSQTLLNSFQPILSTDRFDSYQMIFYVYLSEYKYFVNPNDNQLCEDIKKLYNQFIKQMETNNELVDISAFMKISKITSNIFISATDSAMAFKVADKLIDCIFSTMPLESVDLLKEAASGSKKQKQFNNGSSNSSVTITTSKWASLKICLDSLLHISSIYELRGRPKEAQYYYERGLLIGIIYGSLKITCEFLVEIGELFYNKHNFIDSKINLELVGFLLNRHQSNQQQQQSPYCLKVCLLLSNMLLGDLYRKQGLVSKSCQYYNKTLEIIQDKNNTSSLIDKFSNSLSIQESNNDSTPKEARLMKLLSSKSINVNNNNNNNNVGGGQKLKEFTIVETIDHLVNQPINPPAKDSNEGNQKSYRLLLAYEPRIQGKLAKLQILEKKYESAIDCLDRLIHQNTTSFKPNDITLTILEFHLGKAYFYNVDENVHEKIWSFDNYTSNTTSSKPHPNIASARELFLRAFQRIGKFNLIKLNASICKYICLSTGTQNPFVGTHFLNLAIGIKSRHDMQTIIQHHHQNNNQDKKSLAMRQSIFSWNGGVDLPSNLTDSSFTNQLKKLYSTELPSQWISCNIAHEGEYLILCRLSNNQVPILSRVKIPLIDNNQNDPEHENNGDDDDEEMEMEMEMEEDEEVEEDEDDNNNDINQDDGETKMTTISFSILDKIKGGLKTIEIENLLNNKENSPNFSNTEDSKKAWFYRRKVLEFEMKNILNSIDQLIGSSKHLLIGPLMNPNVIAMVQKSKQNILQELSKYSFPKNQPCSNSTNSKKTPATISPTFNINLLDHLFTSLPFLSFTTRIEMIIELLGYSKLDAKTQINNIVLKNEKTGVYDTQSTFDNHPNQGEIEFVLQMFIDEFINCFNTNSTGVISNSKIPKTLETCAKLYLSQKRMPVVFIIDKVLQSFPIETLEPFSQSSTYRVPSFAFQRHLTLDSTTGHCKQEREYVDTKSLFYIINPSGGLSETQDYFIPLFNKHFPSWAGIAGQIPTKPQYQNALEDNEIFFYMGHGSGEQYFRGDRIQKLSKCGVSILMGCKSGHLEEQGEFEPTGIILDFLLAGSKAVIGNIFDVPTSDCDRLTRSFIKTWFLNEYDPKDVNSINNQDMDISYALAIARKSCEWKYLVGGSCISYGIPIYLKR